MLNYFGLTQFLDLVSDLVIMEAQKVDEGFLQMENSQSRLPIPKTVSR